MYVTLKQLDAAISDFRAEVDEEVDIRLDYSGRGMYGQKCIGVVGSSVTVALRFMFCLVEQTNENDDTWEQRESVMELAEEMRVDDMGYNSFIYYFPELRISEASDD